MSVLSGPSDINPSQWRESVLSTRSLSYTTPAPQPNPADPFAEITTSRKSTLTAIPDTPTTSADLEMTSPSPSSSRRPLPASSTPSPLPPTVATSPLFLLPRELRLQIYTHLLSSPLGINYPSSTLDRGLTPQLLRLNHALHAETAPVLYAANRPIFSHPSDANVFRHAIASPAHAGPCTTSMILRIKNADARLWTAYFNSNAPERSLGQDYPALKQVVIRFRGPRFAPVYSAEQNAVNWLRDAKLFEVVMSVRKCVEDVRVEMCVKVPDDWRMAVWEEVVAKVAIEQEEGGGGGEMVSLEAAVGLLKRREGYLGIWGVWVKLETEGT